MARAIRANRFARIIRNRNPYFYSASGRFARITRISDNHATKFRTPGTPIRKILGHTGVLPCLVPERPQIMQTCISFRSRSDLVLDADHTLDFLGTHLVLQTSISFCNVLEKSGAFLKLPCSHKNCRCSYNSHGNHSCNCNCNLAAQIIL